MNLKPLTSLAIAALMTLFAWTAAAANGQAADDAAPAAAGNQTTCPIKGGKIDKKVYVDVDGKRVYFCCKMGCPQKFMKDADANVKKLEDSGVKLADAPITQKSCLVSNEEIDPYVYVDYQGKRVYFCCKDCVKKFKADPAGYLKKLENQQAADTDAHHGDMDGDHDMHHMNHEK